MTPERLFLEHLDLIELIVRSLAHRHHLTRAEAEDLSSSAKLKILEDDYAVLRRFEGRSSLRTYLTAVINRHFLDERIARWGRWRPSAQARRMGPSAVLLEQLVVRDGAALDSAIAQVLARANGAVSERELRLFGASLPRRVHRRFVAEDVLVDLPALNAASDSLDERRCVDDWERTEHALASALTQLSSDDRLLVKLRFAHGLKISQIARLTGLEQKPLYRRIDGIMAMLRHDLEDRGVTRDQIAALIGNPVAGAEPLLEPLFLEKPIERPSL